MPEVGGVCRNCGAALVGPFCHRCGQQAVDPRMPVRRLIADALGDLLAFDSRVLRTLRPLFLRPGFLTAEWCKGRRVPYVPPLRLYFFVAALFFLILAVTHAQLLVVQITEKEEATPSVTGPPEETPAGATLTQRLLLRFNAAWQKEPDALQDRFIDRLGRLALLLPPAFGLLLALFYRRRRRLLVEHLVFSLHLHAFAFLLLGALALLPEPLKQSGGGAVMVGVDVVYLFVALRRFYGGRIWVTALREAALGFGYFLFGVVPTMVLALAWTVATS